jgi:hypothetical protein
VLSSGIAIDAWSRDLAELMAIEELVDAKQGRSGRGQVRDVQA